MPINLNQNNSLLNSFLDALRKELQRLSTSITSNGKTYRPYTQEFPDVFEGYKYTDKDGNPLNPLTIDSGSRAIPYDQLHKVYISDPDEHGSRDVVFSDDLETYLYNDEGLLRRPKYVNVLNRRPYHDVFELYDEKYQLPYETTYEDLRNMKRSSTKDLLLSGKSLDLPEGSTFVSSQLHNKEDYWKDPSENFLNETMAFGIGGLRGLTANAAKSAVSSGAEWSPLILLQSLSRNPSRVGRGILKVFDFMTPSTYLGAGNYNTVMGGIGRSLAGAFADAGLASKFMYDAGSALYNNPNLLNGVMALLASTPLATPVKKGINFASKLPLKYVLPEFRGEKIVKTTKLPSSSGNLDFDKLGEEARLLLSDRGLIESPGLRRYVEENPELLEITQKLANNEEVSNLPFFSKSGQSPNLGTLLATHLEGKANGYDPGTVYSVYDRGMLPFKKSNPKVVTTSSMGNGTYFSKPPKSGDPVSEALAAWNSAQYADTGRREWSSIDLMEHGYHPHTSVTLDENGALKFVDQETPYSYAMDRYNALHEMLLPRKLIGEDNTVGVKWGLKGYNPDLGSYFKVVFNTRKIPTLNSSAINPLKLVYRPDFELGTAINSPYKHVLKWKGDTGFVKNRNGLWVKGTFKSNEQAQKYFDENRRRRLALDIKNNSYDGTRELNMSLKHFPENFPISDQEKALYVQHLRDLSRFWGPGQGTFHAGGLKQYSVLTPDRTNVLTLQVPEGTPHWNVTSGNYSYNMGSSRPLVPYPNPDLGPVGISDFGKKALSEYNWPLIEVKGITDPYPVTTIGTKFPYIVGMKKGGIVKYF